jgi:hypothetical protein
LLKQVVYSNQRDLEDHSLSPLGDEIFMESIEYNISSLVYFVTGTESGGRKLLFFNKTDYSRLATILGAKKLRQLDI